jgi:hypothetical protein
MKTFANTSSGPVAAGLFMATAAIAVCSLGLASGCTKRASTVSPPKVAARSAESTVEAPAAETWDRQALASVQPCLLTLGGDGVTGLRAMRLDGTTAASDLWDPPADTTSLLLDVASAGPDVVISVSEPNPEAPADIRDRIVVLRADGAVTVASEPTTAYPLVGGAVLLARDELLWLRRRETQSSIETTLGMTDPATGVTVPVSLQGTWPTYRYMAGLVPTAGARSVGVVLKTDGSPAPHDEFAVVLATYDNGRLVARSNAYFDDSLYTLAPGPEAGTLVYARAKGEESSQADEIMQLSAAGGRWSAKILLPNAACDPGFDYQHVCGAGPDLSVLYRAATDPNAPSPAAALMMLAKGTRTPKATGVSLDVTRSQWLWLGQTSP